MKQGWLLVNQFLETKKFTEHYDWLQQAAHKRDIRLVMKKGGELLQDGSKFVALPRAEEKPDFVLFWDKDVRLALALEGMGLRLFNSAKAVALCDDKSLTYLALLGKIPMPQTICAPMTYPSVGYRDLSFVKEAAAALDLPLIIKECYGSFGRQVHLVHTEEEALALTRTLAGVPFIFQKFIPASFGRDVRLQVVGNRVIAAMLRHNESGDFRANITGGAKMSPFEPGEEMKALALRACELLGLDFAGVDFLFGENGEPVLCEVNSNAHFRNLYDCTGVNAAEAIMDWIDAKTH